MAFSSIKTRSATLMASAPSLPPSPMIAETMGVGRSDIMLIVVPMAAAMPRSSDSSPA